MKFFKSVSPIFKILVPIIIAIFLLNAYNAGNRKANDIGLGIGTIAHTGIEKGYPSHIMNLNLADSLAEGHRLRGSLPLCLWMGNSQLHGINQYSEGQQNSVEFLSDSLAELGIEALGVSYPNGNLQEFLMSSIYMSRLLPVKVLILPVFYDDMRESGIRDVVRTKALLDSVKTDSLYFMDIASLRNLESTNISAESGDDFKAVNETAQDKSERWLNKKLEKHWDLWASRPDLRANLLNDLYIFRNMALGINPGTVRKMIPDAYANNFKAFEQLIRFCRDKEIRLLVYIPPIRHDVALPYDLKEYAAFKQQVLKAAVSGGASFINLEGLINSRYWGMKKSTNSFNGKLEVDFMHFQEEGHRRVADTVSKSLRHMLSQHDF